MDHKRQEPKSRNEFRQKNIAKQSSDQEKRIKPDNVFFKPDNLCARRDLLSRPAVTIICIYEALNFLF